VYSNIENTNLISGGLMKEIKRFLEERMGSYSFYFRHIDSGYTYAYNENVVMTAAGCIKLPIAAALLKNVEEGKLNLKESFHVKRDDKVYGNGILHEFGERDYTLGELMVAMLIQSDNTAANKIIDVLSMDNINSKIDEMGLVSTRLNRKTVDDGVKDNNIENLSSSKDLSKCWKMLYECTYLNQEHSDILISILKRQQKKNKLAYYIPDYFKKSIASKSGDMEGVENDTALMLTSKGTFVLTIMSQNLPNSIYGNVTIARAGKMAWDIICSSWSRPVGMLRL
jgi:beta-lactamase class A